MVCCAALFLTGCPYKAGHQLGNPSVKSFDAAILGTWRGCDPENKTDCGRMAVYRFNESEYYAEMTDVGHSGQGININTDRYRAFMTDIGVPGLLDVQELSGSTDTNKEHFFIKAEVQPDKTLRLSYISDDFTRGEFPTAEKLAAHIRANHAKPGFFETLQALEREK